MDAGHTFFGVVNAPTVCLADGCRIDVRYRIVLVQRKNFADNPFDVDTHMELERRLGLSAEHGELGAESVHDSTNFFITGFGHGKTS